MTDVPVVLANTYIYSNMLAYSDYNSTQHGLSILAGKQLSITSILGMLSKLIMANTNVSSNALVRELLSK